MLDRTPGGVASILPPVPRILIVSDSSQMTAEVRSAFDPDTDEIWTVSEGRDVAAAVAEHQPDLVITDAQVGSMGGMAICMHLRLEESGSRLPHVGVLMVVDRRPDVFLARRAGSDGWLVKPLDPRRLRRAVSAILAGERFEDTAYTPVPSLVLVHPGALPPVPPHSAVAVAGEGHAP